jgi:glycosyltransferase involved in cell wall biosynthesis
MLTDCLKSIAQQAVPQGVLVDVVVVDNEADPNNQALVQKLSKGFPFPIRYVHEARRGIPQARNAALDACFRLGADWIAFTDDDCLVGPRWLSNLLEIARRHRGDIVAGGRQFRTQRGTDTSWLPHTHENNESAGQARRYASTHNVLFSARLIGPGQSGLRFDERLAHGEDTDFFHRASQRGAHLVHSDELVFETLTQERCSLRYRVKHAYYAAASRSYFHQRHQSSAAIAAKLSARLFVQVPVAALRLICAPLVRFASEYAFRKLTLKGILRIAGAMGAAAGLLGFIGNPYRKIDGY